MRAKALAVATAAAAAAALYLWRRRRSAAAAAAAALPPSFVISLARRSAKGAAALERAAAAGLADVALVEAVDGKALSADELRRRGVAAYAGWRLEGTGFRFFDRELKWGEIGCGLSHAAVWSRLDAMGAPAAIVLEDDVDFSPLFAELLRAALAEVGALVAAGAVEGADALYLTRRAMRPENDRLLPRCGAGGPAVRLVVPGFSYKTTAYVLWASGARKLLASGYERKLIPVDDFLALTYAPHEAKAGVARPDLDAAFADAPRMRFLAVRPQICWERRGLSDTENTPLITAPPAARAAAPAEQGRAASPTPRSPPPRDAAAEAEARAERLVRLAAAHSPARSPASKAR